jgi:hypothetical protein
MTFSLTLLYKQFIKLGVNGLRVSMLTLNEESHQQRCDACNSLPVEGLAVKDQPKGGINAHHPNGQRAGQPCPSIRQKTI